MLPFSKVRYKQIRIILCMVLAIKVRLIGKNGMISIIVTSIKVVISCKVLLHRIALIIKIKDYKYKCTNTVCTSVGIRVQP